ncbi:DUF3349 domain-containing protein [Rhodococcus sp. D2-41]|uniref:DUF3349 domain-containing protein n=1 Tax=Speluncibacter jeojiensis TaxID=2710754 RepID=A0A9X4RIG7_9ACTN|nr:DUF3349 domain-containing protein [Rhodococcus sp. D2-41]MDG3009224.1 DUF3349 domain-containing protein [Rhodococcus sp. D2-41]MDG3016101.1 DUF3349 domain-containing protein [Corynebacteriales bacterium D3-21]
MRPLIGSILDWLRAGYPDGIPPKDYVPLLAVLRRKLTDAEVREVVEILDAETPRPDDAAGPEAPPTPISTADIEATISQLTNEEPLEDDVRRVAARLAAGGWPLAEPARAEADLAASAEDDPVDAGVVDR